MTHLLASVTTAGWMRKKQEVREKKSECIHRRTWPLLNLKQTQVSKSTDINSQHILLLLECNTWFPALQSTAGSRCPITHTRSMPSSDTTRRLGWTLSVVGYTSFVLHAALFPLHPRPSEQTQELFGLWILFPNFPSRHHRLRSSPEPATH